MTFRDDSQQDNYKLVRRIFEISEQDFNVRADVQHAQYQFRLINVNASNRA